VPATYVHSLMGSRNWYAGLAQTGRARTINREKLDVENLIAELKNPESFRARVFNPYTHMIRTRTSQPAFHPNAGFDILDLGPQVFGIMRKSSAQTLWAVTNITGKPTRIDLTTTGADGKLKDLMTETLVDPSALELGPYQFMWLS
jgi:sucrose phosphorylase